MRKTFMRQLLKISDDSVVSFLYILKDEAGAIIDQSDGEPMAYLHGHGQIVPGLERELAGKSAGEKLLVRVSPADGYGEYDAALIQKVPREAFSTIPDLRVGMPLATRTRSGGQAQVIVREIDPDAVTVDGNHPLAGKDLFFDIEIVEVRVASEEELVHQHVHGPGGHHH
jgi:FKBP-type peptidyl-prolyl cis-trans isomerase SlyD